MKYLNYQKKKTAIRIITNSHSCTSCRDLFKELNILPLQSQYILSLAVGEVCTGCWWESLRERDHWGDPDVDGRIILRGIFRK
jgi:hypothetical protein